MKAKILTILLFLSTSILAECELIALPDSKLTPGVADKKLTKEVICSDSFKTGDYRDVPESEKNKVYESYNVKPHSGYCSGREGCEVDHLIPLYVGGSNNIKNLWPQPYVGTWNAHMKDKLEMKLHKMVCNNEISLKQAQEDISSDWTEAYKKYIGE